MAWEGAHHCALQRGPSEGLREHNEHLPMPYVHPSHDIHRPLTGEPLLREKIRRLVGHCAPRSNWSRLYFADFCRIERRCPGSRSLRHPIPRLHGRLFVIEDRPPVPEASDRVLQNNELFREQ